MYDELIKWLRVFCEGCKLWDGCKCCVKGECSQQKSLQAADAIEELSRLHEAQQNLITMMNEYPETEWIPVTERLPEYMENVLVTDGVFSGMGWRDWYDYRGTKPREDYWIAPSTNVNELNITHWMPLPEPPKDGE